MAFGDRFTVSSTTLDTIFALVANKLNKENQAMKDLIIQLIKENQKIKTENKLLIKNMN